MRICVATLLASALSLGAAHAASAADMPVKARRAPASVVAHTFTGIYAGGQVGGGWSTSTMTNVDGTHFFNFIGETRSIDDSSVVGGVFGGIQRQFGTLVFGAEGGAAWGTFTDTIQAPGPFFASDNYKTEISNIYYAVGRIGAAFDRVLLYVKGGWATARVRTQSDEVPAFFHYGVSSERHHGYVVGGGAEYAYNSFITAGIDYSYYDLGNKTHVGVDFPLVNFSNYVVDVHPKVHTVMGRLIFKTNWGQ